MNRRGLLLAGAASLVPAWAGAQCVTSTPAVDACRGGVNIGGAPALDLNFIGGAALDSRITFTRAAGPATYFDASGVMQTAGTNVARFDYDPVTHALKGLLIEEARTNILTNSRAINSWPTKTDSTVTDNSTASPDGTVNASLVTEGSAGTAVVVSNAAAIAGSSVMSFSVFLKRGNQDILRILCADTASANGVQTWANLATVAVASTGARGTATGAVAAIQAIGNGWYRVTLGCTMAAGSTIAAVNVNSASVNASTTRVNGATYYLWGAQTEVGGFATSHIPTTGASATRAVDVATLPVDAAWFNTLAGTWAAEGEFLGFAAGLRLIGNPTTTVAPLYFSAAGLSVAFDGAAIQTANAATANSRTRAASAWSGGTGAVVLNAGTVVTGAQATGFSGLTTIKLMGANTAPTTLSGRLARVRYWPRAFSASELQWVTA